MVLQIHIPVCNNPEYIRLQAHTLNRFCQDPFKITIFNDAKSFPDMTNHGDLSLKQQIIDVCKELDILCILIDNSQDSTIDICHRHARTMNIMWHNYEKNLDDPLLVLDSDMFPVRPFSLLKELETYDFSFTLQTRNDVQYIWPNLFWCVPSRLQNKDLLDWSVDTSRGCDTGGASDTFLKLSMSEKFKEHHHLPSLQWSTESSNSYTDIPDCVLRFCEQDIKNVDGKFWCELYHNTFLHTRASSNWENICRSIHNHRTQALRQVLLSL